MSVPLDRSYSFLMETAEMEEVEEVAEVVADRPVGLGLVLEAEAVVPEHMTHHYWGLVP